MDGFNFGRGTIMSLKKLLLGAALSVTGLSISAPAATAQADPFIGQISPMGFNFCPRGWAATDGQLLPIASNSALFSLLGTIYGGDGRTTFALPDLRSRVPVHFGTGAGLSNYIIGQRGGVETTTMTINQMPSHTHQGGILVVPQLGDTRAVRSNAFANSETDNNYIDNVAPSAPNFMHVNTVVIQNTGGGQSQTNIQPYLALNYCIALQGIFPSRN